MSSLSSLKLLIQNSISEKIPEAFKPKTSFTGTFTKTGINEFDSSLRGIPHGELTEICGGTTSGSTTLALSFLAEVTQKQLGAFVDVSDSLDIESCCAAGINLSRLLWIRCCEEPKKAGKDSPPAPLTPCQPWSQKSLNQTQRRLNRTEVLTRTPQSNRVRVRKETWKRLEQALKVTDLLLHDRGFGAVVLDFAGIPARFTRRVPLTSWFRFSRTLRGSPTAMVLLSRQACSQSVGRLVLDCHCLTEQWDNTSQKSPSGTISTFRGFDFEVNPLRHRTQLFSSLHNPQPSLRSIQSSARLL